MSNSRSFRHGLKALAALANLTSVPVSGATGPPDPGWLERRPPWNKGLALTKTPSASTVRRRLRHMEAQGVAERSARRPGKPGDPVRSWSLTEKGWQLRDIARILDRVGWDASALMPEHADMLISLGYAAREKDGRVVFLEDYQEAWKYWRSKRDATAGAPAGAVQTG